MTTISTWAIAAMLAFLTVDKAIRLLLLYRWRLELDDNVKRNRLTILAECEDLPKPLTERQEWLLTEAREELSRLSRKGLWSRLLETYNSGRAG